MKRSPEKVILRTSNTRKLYIPFYFIFLIITIFLAISIVFSQSFFIDIFLILFFVLVSVLLTEIHRIYNSYEVNTNSVVHIKGYLARKSRRMNYFAISEIVVHQSFFQRVLGFGNVELKLYSGAAPASIINIDKPHSFASLIEDRIKALRTQGDSLKREEDFGETIGEEIFLDF